MEIPIMRIRESKPKDFKGMIRIAKRLHPIWYENYCIKKLLPIDLRIQKSFVAEEKRKIIGFIAYTSDDAKVKISWLGVSPEFHRQGVGTKLISRVEKELKKIGVKEIRLETVAESTKYEPYKKTRAFYKKLGFKVEKVRKARTKDTGERIDLATFVKKL